MSASGKPTETEPVQAFVRIRPFIDNEQKSNCIETLTPKDIILKVSYHKKFTFDEVFGPKCKQVSIFNAVAKSYISDVVSGYNCTIITYGQALTGKTYTMNGLMAKISNSVDNLNQTSSSSNPEPNFLTKESGILPRAIVELFSKLALLKEQWTLGCTYIELYNEELHDLLSDNHQSIRIYDDRRNKGNVILQGVHEVTVTNKHELFKLLIKGQNTRQITANSRNEKAASHCIFTMYVRRQETIDGEELIKVGKLCLVDLTGSENITKNSTTDRRIGKNQSLLTLGRVINAFSEKNSHIPFRDSKLTRILQDSLGGKTKTSIIATITCSMTSFEDTLSTLEYAYKCRTIINRPEPNQKISQKVLMAQYIDEVARLRKDLAASRTGNGIVLDSDNYDQMLSTIQNLRDESSQQKNLISSLENTIKKQENKNQIIATNFQSRHSNLSTSTTKYVNQCSENFKNINVLEMQQSRIYNEISNGIHEIKNAVNNMQIDLPKMELSSVDLNVKDRIASICLPQSEDFTATAAMEVISSDFQNIISKNNNKTNLLQQRIKTLQEYVIKNNQQQQARNVKDEINNMDNPLFNFLSEHISEESHQSELLQERLTTTCEAIISASEQFAANMSNNLNEKRTILSDKLENVLSGNRKQEEKVENFCQKIKNSSQNVNFYQTILNKINQLRVITQDLTEGISEVKNAGDTPVHAKCTFPKLKDLTPREKVLTRFRRAQSAIEGRSTEKENLEN